MKKENKVMTAVQARLDAKLVTKFKTKLAKNNLQLKDFLAAMIETYLEEE